MIRMGSLLRHLTAKNHPQKADIDLDLKSGQFDFKKLWNETKDEASRLGTHQKSNDEQNDVFSDVFFTKVALYLSAGSIGVEALVSLIEKRIHRTLAKDAKKNRNRKLLLRSIMLLLGEKTDNTALVRQCLTSLYAVSHYIDREVFLFEHHKENNLEYLPDMCKIYIKQRRTEILRHIGGWRVPNRAPWNVDHDMMRPELYLELPYRRAHNLSNSHLMAEALYREQDPELALMLLRHGVPASFLYLWPVCILIDLKETLHSGLGISKATRENQIAVSEEAKMIRYFCRARHYVQIHLILTPHDRDIQNLAGADNFDNYLMLPPVALAIVPKDRYECPSSLMQQCRLCVRKRLLDTDHLPAGIQRLPLPKLIRNFIDLLED